MAKKNISIYISFLLRHKPEDIGLKMDNHGWVSVEELIAGINKSGKYKLTEIQLEEIVKQDNKGRYRFNKDHSKIKACQGHSIPWVEPEMEYLAPPKYLYHGTTTIAVEKIMASKAICKMNRHAVHMQEDLDKAWKSATRWHLIPVVLKIDAERMYKEGYVFGRTENNVWCTETVPTAYIVEQVKEIEKIIHLFLDEKVIICEVKNTSHGELDFREAWIVELETGKKYVIKLADNDFTFADKIKMWQRCSYEYQELGYYTPTIFPSKFGTFPMVQYKGHNCVAYMEEFSKYACLDESGKGIASSKYLNEILQMTAKIAKLYSDYTNYPSGYCLFHCFSPSDENDEVMENALEWKRYAQTLPELFQPQVKRIWEQWSKNRIALREVYHQLPTSVFQADLNSSNILIDEKDAFVGVCDFNLSGKDVLLNYLFREIRWEDDEEELKMIRSAISIVGEIYQFSEMEKYVAPMLYRCIKPLWYTRIEQLKKAGNDFCAIQTCLDKAELALTRELNFFIRIT